MLDRILLVAAAVAAAAGFLWRRRITARADPDMTAKKRKRQRTPATMLTLIGLYVFATRLINIVFGVHESGKLEVSIWPERVDFLGFKLTTTVIYSWCAMILLIALAIVLRLTVLRRLREQPRGLQNAIELAMEKILSYADSQAHGSGEFLASYIFAVALFLVSCAFLELFGLRTPASDIMLTFALALITFVLINAYGIRKKGLGGRIKSLASPTPVVFIIRVVTDLAIPVSMASRLFGNMLGGMIVMDLVYSSLGNNAIGLPSVVGLYFNIFHPLIQAFIFVTLTLTFINEAIE
ncbi:MAG: F0F1 ATP synthase subunit A [Oscillospiraceae bacterium]|jgi:F-type H+-transporting ATPase subunit a|nr:F0F1 ATP synthase subunit A [Oscillospiraceae bacterium]